MLEIQSSGEENIINMNCHVNGKNNEVSANPFFSVFSAECFVFMSVKLHRWYTSSLSIYV